MKTFAKTILVLVLTLGVMIGQTGIAMAEFTTAKALTCKNCPCDSKKSTCCIGKSGQAPVRHDPAVPQVETRLVQPATVYLAALISPDHDQPVANVSLQRHSSLTSISSVPLFLRHRAIRI